MDDAPSGPVASELEPRPSNAPPPTPPTFRAPGVDALRAIAALMVVVCHLSYVGLVAPGPWSSVLENGRHGVQIFFVLSGFLLAGPFLRGPVDLRVYGIRRLARILPAYLLALVGISLLSGSHAVANDPLRYLLFVQQPPHGPDAMLQVGWSLQIEAAFYICLPLFAVALLRTSGPGIRRGLLILATVGFASWLLGHVLWLRASPTYDPSPLPSLMLPAELWAFIPGVAVAMVAARDPAVLARLSQPRFAVLGAALLCISFAGHQVGLLEVAGLDLLVAVATAVMLPFAARSVSSVPRPVAVLATVGVVASYAIYLWHVDVMRAVERQGFTGLPGVVIALALTALIAAISWVLVERPSLRWSDGAVAAIRRSRSAPDSLRKPVVGATDVAGS